MNEIEAFVILRSIPQLGAIKIRQLVKKFGSALKTLEASTEEISQLSGFSRVLPHWNQWKQNQDWQRDLYLAKQYGTQLIPFTSPLFPKPLLELPDPPVLLYVQGEIKPQDVRSIAIVGTRNASIYGNEMAEQISKELTANGFTVISGLARGIDTAAHRGALANGRTVAVIGSGLTNIYPPENRSLAKEISQKGALISEFSMETPPDRQNFPQRNRIVSGMTLGTLLIEAPVKSGAMITMEKACAQKRQLFALPGRADNENFRGNHLLIKSGKAKLIENATDILSHFEGLFSFSMPKTPSFQTFHFDPLETKILTFMNQEEIHIDALTQLINLPVHQIHTTLMGLVLKKAIKEFPGKLYKKIVIG